MKPQKKNQSENQCGDGSLIVIFVHISAIQSCITKRRQFSLKTYCSSNSKAIDCDTNSSKEKKNGTAIQQNSAETVDSFNKWYLILVNEDLKTEPYLEATSSTNNWLTYTYTYRNLNGNRTTSQVNSLETQDGKFSYTYDNRGNIKTISDGTYTTTYTYDNLDQLLREDNQKLGKPIYSWRAFKCNKNRYMDIL